MAKEAPTVAEQTTAALAEAAKEQPAPAPAPDADPEETGDNATDWAEDQAKPAQQPGQVPTAAVHEEREKRRLAEERTEAIARELAELRGYVFAQQQPQQRQDPAPEAEPEIVIPDPSEDLAGYLKATEQQRQRNETKQAEATRQVQEWIAGQKRAAQQSEYRQALAGTIASHEVQFRQATPDYDQALAHLAKERMGDLLDAKIEFGRAQKIVTDELVAFAEHALSQRMNPAATIYALAQRRGYGASAPAATNGLAAQIAQQPAPEAPQQRRQPSPAALAEGAIPGGGGAPVATSGLQAVIDASDREIAADPAKFLRMLGGPG